MSQVLELSRFTVKPENVDEFLARRPAMLDAIHRHYPGFVSAHLARLEGDVWVDMAFWENIEQCQFAINDAPNIQAVAAWLELIGDDLAMEQGQVIEPVAALAWVTG